MGFIDIPHCLRDRVVLLFVQPKTFWIHTFDIDWHLIYIYPNSLHRKLLESKSNPKKRSYNYLMFTIL